MKKRLLILLLVFAAIGGGIYYSLTLKETEITLTGIVTTEGVIANAQIQGRLDKLLVDEGDIIKKGQLLATIQPAQWQADMNFYNSSQQQAATQVSQAQADLRYQELQSQNQIAQANANLAAANAQVAEAAADEENARLTFEHEQAAYNKGVESLQIYDQSRMNYQSQKAHAESLKKQALAAQSAVELAKSTQQQIAVRRAAVEAMEHQAAAATAQKDKAQVELDYTKIYAPVDGIIDVRASRQGEVVNPGQAIFTILNPDDLWVRADVEETYIDRIHIGDTLTVRLPSGKELPGKVFYRSVDADFATQRDVSRTKRDIKTFEVRLRCDNQNRNLAVGMTAYILLPLNKSTLQTTAPRNHEAHEDPRK